MQRILVIDDEPAFRETVQKVLGRGGYEALTAEDGVAGLRLAQSHRPDLILTDVQMADCGGFEVLTRLRELPETSGIPVILMTGHREDQVLRRGMDSGADDFLFKPFTPSALLSAVEVRLRNNKAVREQAERTRDRMVAILEATTDLVGILDLRTGSVLYLNRAGRTMLGLASEHDGVGLRFEEFHPEAALSEIRKVGIPTALRDGSWSGETMIRRGDGSELTVSQVILAHRATDGSVDYLSTILRDITERKRVEEALRRSEERFRLITENATELIAIVDAQCRRLYNNPAYERVLGYQRDELQSTHSLEQVHPEDREIVLSAARDSMATGRSHAIEYRMRHKDETWRTLESHGAVIRNPSGAVDGILIVARDITERKRAEQDRVLMELQLRQAQKLESIGQLAAGIAHEINTPTQYIGDNTHFLQESTDGLFALLKAHERLADVVTRGESTEEPLRELQDLREQIDSDYLLEEIPRAIQQSIEGVERVSRIVGAMKDFSHPGTAEKTAMDLNRAIDSTITVARNEWKYVAEVVRDYDPDLPAVPCLPGEFHQVILNLLVNAAHAIAQVNGTDGNRKGRITVSTRRRDDRVEIRIEDTGCGIPEAIRNRVFEPFFTTKPLGKGTGQGLAIARSAIVDKHGGELDFESGTGGGTTFIVRLPLGADIPNPENNIT